jgi:hypothetical protein
MARQTGKAEGQHMISNFGKKSLPVNKKLNFSKV